MTQPNDNSPHSAAAGPASAANGSASADDLDWLAFCYVAGELSDGEIAHFESLLAESQTAREQLAAAVALTQTIADGLAPSHATVGQPSLARSSQARSPAASNPSRRRAFTRAIAWCGVAAAVVLAAIWLGGQLPNRDDATALPSPNDQLNVELATAWASWLDEETAVAESSSADSSSADDASADDLVAGNVAADRVSAAATDDELPDAPDWMLAALGGESISAEPTPDPTEPDLDDTQTDPIRGDAAQDG